MCVDLRSQCPDRRVGRKAGGLRIHGGPRGPLLKISADFGSPGTCPLSPDWVATCPIKPPVRNDPPPRGISWQKLLNAGYFQFEGPFLGEGGVPPPPPAKSVVHDTGGVLICTICLRGLDWARCHPIRAKGAGTWGPKIGRFFFIPLAIDPEGIEMAFKRSKMLPNLIFG